MAEITATMNQAVKAMVGQDGKFLTFVLDGEEYGIGILKIKEIILGTISKKHSQIARLFR